MVYESKTENHRLIFTVGSAAVLTFDLCMHQRTHSAKTVQTRVYHATSSVNKFLHNLLTHYTAILHIPTWQLLNRNRKKIKIFMIQQIKNKKKFDVRYFELYNYCSYNKPQYWPRNAQLFHLYSCFTFYFQSKPRSFQSRRGFFKLVHAFYVFYVF